MSGKKNNKEDELNKLKIMLQKKEKKLNKINGNGNMNGNGNLNGNGNMSGSEIEINNGYDNISSNELYCRIGNKRTICLYGLHKKLPVSLHPEQWEQLYQYLMSGKLHKFIEENKSLLNDV